MAGIPGSQPVLSSRIVGSVADRAGCSPSRLGREQLMDLALPSDLPGTAIASSSDGRDEVSPISSWATLRAVCGISVIGPEVPYLDT